MIYKYKVACNKEQLRDIRQFVDKVLKKYLLPEVEINKLVLAVDEVCANLMIHSHHCNPEDFIELTIKVKENESIVFEISDKGEGFNLCNYKEPSLVEIVKEKKKGGIGLLLVNRIMDEIEFKREPEVNVCKLYKKI